MDSNKIIEFAKLFEISDFLGVFAVDELALIPKRRTGLVIFNTDTSDSIYRSTLDSSMYYKKKDTLL